MIEGVSLHSLKQISVPKGDLWHAFKMNDEGFVGFGEAYLTQIEPHQIKGWKRHNRYVLNIVVIVGAVKFVIDKKVSQEDNLKRLSCLPFTIINGLRWLQDCGWLLPGLQNRRTAY